MDKPQPIYAAGDFGSLSQSSRTALEYAARVIAEDHGVGNGATALYWHLHSVAAKHVADGKAKGSAPSTPREGQAAQ